MQQQKEESSWKYVLRLKLCSLNDFLLYFPLSLLLNDDEEMSHVWNIFSQSSQPKGMLAYRINPAHLIRASRRILSLIRLLIHHSDAHSKHD